MTVYFIQAFIYLCAAVITVPLSKKLGLGSVLGYLVAGLIIGPITGLVGHETVTIQHFAEFGVVMMLFLVGLELDPKSLWTMRNKLFGLGGLQVFITIAAVTYAATIFGLAWNIALTIGLIFSLSSTAIVLQTFNEKNLVKTEGGKNAFSVLLFQDIAVIPMLALIPLLAIPELSDSAQQVHSLPEMTSSLEAENRGNSGSNESSDNTTGSESAHATADDDHHINISLVSNLPPWAHALVVIGAILAVIIGGHYLSRPLFHYIAASGLREIFTASALMLVIGIAALMSLVGLSPALGTFLAGVILANSEFRHELESEIEPFKGLLLGLFFITVGAGINFSVLAEKPFAILGITLGVMLIKGLILFGLSFIFRVKGSNRWLFSVSLAQAGEFGFVLLSYTTQHDVLSPELTQFLSLVVTISMFLTPLLFIFFDRVILPKYAQKENQEATTSNDEIEPGSVIIAGIGRFGQIINRMLVANDIKTVVLDHQAGQVESMRNINIKSYFGDACRPDLLHTAGIDQAAMIVVAIDDRARSVELVQHVKKSHPNVKILARAFDRGHNYQLRHAGADIIISETYYSALEMAKEALGMLGYHPFKAQQLKQTFLDLEQAESNKLYKSWRDEEQNHAFTKHYRELFKDLEGFISEAMEVDRADKHSRSERGWTPPPKEYAKEFEKEFEKS